MKSENTVLNKLLSGIMSEGPEKFGKYGGFADPINTILKYINALNHSNKNFQKAAADALKYVSGEDFGVDEHRWLEWWQDNKNKVRIRLKALYPNNINYP